MLAELTARHSWEAPLISCKGCGRQYSERDWGAVFKVRIGDHLESCTYCDKPKPQPRIFPIPKKVVGRDVACRYIIRFDGSTFWHQTDVDVAEVYLQDREGNVIAKVSQFDTFPKTESIFDDIPF